MANMSIAAQGNQITISLDQYDWQYLQVNNQPITTSFPANVTVQGPMEFSAQYSPGSPAVPQANIVMNEGGGGDDMWVAVVDFQASGDACIVSGTVQYLQSPQVATIPNSLRFFANGLTGGLSASES